MYRVHVLPELGNEISPTDGRILSVENVVENFAHFESYGHGECTLNIQNIIIIYVTVDVSQLII